MVRLYGRFWWSFLIRGILATLFAMVAILLPGITIEIFLILLALFLVVDGLISFAASLQAEEQGGYYGKYWFWRDWQELFLES